MNCPNCGAANPEGAAHCNLCFYNFTGPADSSAAEVAKPVAASPAKPKRFALAMSALDSFLRDKKIRGIALAGGGAAVSGAWLILASFSVLHFLNIRAFDFLFSIMNVDPGKLSLFIVLLSLFGLLVGGIAGNVNDKRAIVPGARVVAAAIGLSLWAGLLQLIAGPSASLTDWLSGGWPGALATLAAFPLAAAAIGACESFGEDWSRPRALAGAIGGAVAGLVTAVIVANTYYVVPVFGTAVPNGFWPVAIFGAKLVLITGIFSFIGGLLLWYAIIAAEKITGEK
jgi:hypothetical protein